MRTEPLHPWTLDPEEAIQIQKRLRERLRLSWDGHLVNSIGGVGIRDGGDIVRVAISIHDFPNRQ
jgi:hypothetical protein